MLRRLFVLLVTSGITGGVLNAQNSEESLSTANEILSDYLQKSSNDLTFSENSSPSISKKAVLKVFREKLYQTYGRKNIDRQKPFQLHFIDGYWVIFGTLPRNRVGGVFEAIYDVNERRIVHVMHGK